MPEERICMKKNIKRLTMTAMLCALAFAALLCRIPVVLWLKYEPKDVVIAIGGFLFGPLTSVVISVVVSLLELTVSDTGIIGAIMNIVSTCAFVCPAAILYKRKRTLGYAALGLVTGAIFATGVMMAWNYFLTPLYMGQPREAVAALLLPAFLPFNLLKTGLNTALTLLIYKPVVNGLRRARLLPEMPDGEAPKKEVRIGVILGAVFLLLSCVLLFLVLRGIL